MHCSHRAVPSLPSGERASPDLGLLCSMFCVLCSPFLHPPPFSALGISRAVQDMAMDSFLSLGSNFSMTSPLRNTYLAETWRLSHMTLASLIPAVWLQVTHCSRRLHHHLDQSLSNSIVLDLRSGARNCDICSFIEDTRH